MSEPRPAWIHPTAIVEEGATLGPGTRIWDGVHLRKGARIGHDCIVGEKTYVAYDVAVGNFVKINAGAYLCAGVEVGDFVMISAHVVFTNDRFPRAGNRGLTALETSDPTEETLRTRVARGATVGANATIGPGLTLGEFCMVGMGAVVTRDVPPHALVVGNPARLSGWQSVCGASLGRAGDFESGRARDASCGRCGREYVWDGSRLRPKGPVPSAP